MTNDTEHLFYVLLAICIFSLEKCLFISFAHISLGCLFVYCWVVRVFLFLFFGRSYFYILESRPLSDICSTNIFFSFDGLHFHFLDGVLWSTKFLILMMSNLCFLLLVLGNHCCKVAMNSFNFFLECHSFSSYI